MFNSGLFANITDYSDHMHNPLILAVNLQYRELFGFEEALWHEKEKAGVRFEDHYRPFFPPGYIERDIVKAKEVINSLRLAAQSDLIRLDFPPICCYVAYHIIQELGSLTRIPKQIWLTEDLQQYMNGMPNKSERYISRTDVKEWFSDLDTWLMDFENTYDPDYVSYELIEAIGELFLQNTETAKRAFQSMGVVDIEALSDLMPFDLRERVLKKIKEQQKDLPADEEIVMRTIISACEKISANPIDYHNIGEDALNRNIRNLLEMVLETKDYSIQDQTQRGYGATRNKPGELDILIKKNGLPVAIIEGLIHKDKEYLIEHIEKATSRYNCSGCRSIIIIEYVPQPNFNDIWDRTIKHLSEYMQYRQSVDTTFDKIKLFEGSIDTKKIHVISIQV